jgi:hypothetical protein
MSAGHDHQDQGDSPVDWFKALDMLVWVSVALIVAMAAEWLIGKLVREKISHQAERYLAKVTSTADTPE